MTGGLLLGFTPDENCLSAYDIYSHDLDLLYLLNSDELDFKNINAKFIIYQGHHGDNGAHAANLILPGLAFSEKESTYVNIEGRIQKTSMAVEFPSGAKLDCEIIQGIASKGNIDIGEINSDVVANIINEVLAKQRLNYNTEIDNININTHNLIPSIIKQSRKQNFYQTNAILRNSKNMLAGMKNNA